jgi:CspA family cold shock protein
VSEVKVQGGYTAPNGERPQAPKTGSGVQPAVLDRHTSTIKWFNTEKGYGFINKPKDLDGDKDIFLHINSLPEGVESVTEGQSVSFQIEQVKKGARAINVKVG